MIRREREKEAKRRRPHIPESADRSTATPGDVLQALKSFFQTLQQKRQAAPVGTSCVSFHVSPLAYCSRLSPAVVQGIFEDAAHTINAYLFNTLVERGELCTSATGFQTKFGLSPIREWFFAAHFENPSRIRCADLPLPSSLFYHLTASGKGTVWFILKRLPICSWWTSSSSRTRKICRIFSTSSTQFRSSTCSLPLEMTSTPTAHMGCQ